MTIITQEDFHNAINKDVGTPTKKYISIPHPKQNIRKEVPKIHAADWAIAKADLTAKVINIVIHINFQQNSLTGAEYDKLRTLAATGIARFWSRPITLNGVSFGVLVGVHHDSGKSIDVDLYIETSNKYARSHNSGLIDASFIYNKGFYGGMNSKADSDFILVAAHEFGHSVLDYFGDSDLSWTHKGSTNKLLQNVKSTTPGYPAAGEVDLMKYYDDSKNTATYSDIYNRTTADEQDVKRLVWLSTLSF